MFLINVFKYKNEQIVFLRQETKWSEILHHLDLVDMSFGKLRFYLIFVSLTMKQRPRLLSDLALWILWSTSESVIEKHLCINILQFHEVITTTCKHRLPLSHVAEILYFITHGTAI